MRSPAATIPSAMLETGSVIYQAKLIDVNGVRTRYDDEGQGEVMLMIPARRPGHRNLAPFATG